MQLSLKQWMRHPKCGLDELDELDENNKMKIRSEKKNDNNTTSSL